MECERLFILGDKRIRFNNFDNILISCNIFSFKDQNELKTVLYS